MNSQYFRRKSALRIRAAPANPFYSGPILIADYEKDIFVIGFDSNETLLSMIKEMCAYAGVYCDTFDNVSEMMEAICNTVTICLSPT